MIAPARQWCIQIDVTNACGRNCSNCTRATAHALEAFYMDPGQYEEALLAIRDFVTDSPDDRNGRRKVVGMIGGEPTLHPKFTNLVRIAEKSLPDKESRGLWTRLGRRYTRYRKLIDRVFGCQNLNPHDGAILHQPILVAIEDVIEDPAARADLLSACWLQEEWSSTITPDGFYFCEVAGALDRILGLGVGGLPVEAGVWNRPLDDFREQIEKICSRCGAAIPLAGRLDDERRDDVSLSNLEALRRQGSPRIEAGDFVLYEPGSLPVGPAAWRPARYVREGPGGARMIRAPKRPPSAAPLRRPGDPSAPAIRKVRPAPRPQPCEEIDRAPPKPAPRPTIVDPLLSICIPSIARRSISGELGELLGVLAPQIEQAGPAVEVLLSIDAGGLLPARKRTDLLFSARGRFIAFIDDDDLVSQDYVAAILEAIRSDPEVDCVTFEGRRTVDGRESCQMIWTTSIDKNIKKPEARWIRANHLSPIRRDLARKSFFWSRTRYGCDQVYWKLLHAAGLLRTQIHLERDLYLYRFSWSGTATQDPAEQEATRAAGVNYYPHRIRRSIHGTPFVAGDLVIAIEPGSNGSLRVLDRTCAIREISTTDLEPLAAFALAIGRPGRYRLQEVRA